MNFRFPNSMNYRPNNQQMELLYNVVHVNKFPGFFNNRALTISTNKKDDEQNYYNYLMTDKDIAENLMSKPFLYIPYDMIQYFILKDYHTISGVVRSSLHVYWLEDVVDFYELWEAEKHGIPIITGFREIGRNAECVICNGYGAIDWVDNLTYRATIPAKEFPKDHYFYVKQGSMYLLLVDSRWILEYQGPNIIYPCPACCGTGSRMMVYQGTKIEPHKAEAVMVNRSVRYVGSRAELIESPSPLEYYSMPEWK